MARSRAVLIFARTPEAEARAKDLRVSRAAPLFEAVIGLWIGAAQRAGAVPIIACSPSDRGRFAAIVPTASPEWIDQGHGNFGERLSGAVSEGFGRGYGAVVVTGIDTPPPESLDRVFSPLESGAADAVIAPATDGGINLIALTADATELLATIRARQGDAARRCHDFFGERLCVLPASGDLDRAADLARALRDRSWALLHPLIEGVLVIARHPHFAPAASDRHVSSMASRAPPFAA